MMSNDRVRRHLAAALEQSLAAHRAGKLDRAAEGYRSILKTAPDHDEALQLLGVTFLQRGQADAAIHYLERAYALNGDAFHISKNYFEACLAARRLPTALMIAERVTSNRPEPEASKMLARVLAELVMDAEKQGDWLGAAGFWERLLPLTSERGAVLCNLGNALVNVGQVAAGVARLEAAVTENPLEMAAWHNLGRACALAGNPARAEHAYREAQRLAPDNLVNALAWVDYWIDQGRWNEAWSAVKTCERSLANIPEFLSRAGRVALECGQFDEAGRHWRRQCELQPGNAEVRCNLARIALDRMDLINARDLCEAAVRIDPGLPEAWLNLGLALHHLDDLAGAKAAYHKAIELSRGVPERRHTLQLAHLNLGRAAMDEGDCEGALPLLLLGRAEETNRVEGVGNYVDALMRVADWRTLSQVLADGIPDGVNPFTVLALTDDPLVQLQAARRYGSKVMGEAAPWKPSQKNSAGNRIRLGYLSSDLHCHATTRLAADLFESHRRESFEIYAYSTGPDDGSEMRRRVVKAFDCFRDLRGRSVNCIDQQIREDGIDILIDLKGYTFRALPEVLARRPAPVQVSYLGYPGSMGTSAIDYLVGDRIVLPDGASSGFEESLLRLPICYQPQDRRWPSHPTTTREDHALPGEHIVLACFNQMYKIGPETFADWMECLRAVPETVLWLLEPGPTARRRLLQAAEEQGVGADRLAFAPLLPHAEHLARIGLADIVLDTFPYGAHTTASDALRCGVPVVTRLGRSFASRVAASLLLHSGLGDLVAETRPAYVERIVRLARSRDLRLHTRNQVRTALQGIVDTSRYVDAFEAMLTHAWERHCAGLPPESLGA